MKKWLWILLACGIPVVVLVLVPPSPQPLWYHDFADQRCLLGVPHALNVLSNLPFVIVGLWGICFLAQAKPLPGIPHAGDRWLFVVFFTAILLTGIGSAYYHWHPNNDRLLWDRLPLAIAIMTLFSIVIAERISRRAATWLFLPLIILGGGSVVYWHATESWGRGDLRPYLLVQLYPLIVLPFILAIFPAKYTRTSDLYWALAWYVGAKALELLDKQVYWLCQFVSGHTLKHLAAAVSGYLILHMLKHRRPISENQFAHHAEKGDKSNIERA